MILEMVGLIVIALFLFYAVVIITGAIFPSDESETKALMGFVAASLFFIVSFCCANVNFCHSPEKYGYQKIITEEE